MQETEKATEVDQGDASEKVPEPLVAQAKALFTKRTDGGLAVLVLDSLIDENAPVSDHQLRFEHPLIGVDIHVSATASGSDLAGRLQPPSPLLTRLELETGDLLPSQETEEGGFAFPRVTHGLVRLHIIGAEGTGPVHTDWFRV